MRYMMSLPLLLFAIVAVGQDSPATRIAPLLTDTAVAVARVDVKSLDVESAWKATRPFLPLEEAELQPIAQVVRGTASALKSAGVEEVFVVIDMREIGVSTGVYLVVPVSKSLNRDALKGLIASLPFEATDELRNAIVCGSNSLVERLKATKDVPRRDDLANAFAATTGPLQVVFAPSADQARILRETLPSLPTELGGATGEQLASSLKWISFGVAFEPKLAVTLIVQSESEQAAEALKTTLEAALRRISRDPKAVAELPILPMIVNMLAPRREGDRLVVKADESLDALAKTLTSLATVARQEAYQKASVNNLRQIGLAMHNFHDKYGSFPPSASYDANGKPLLSWRVFLLPYLDEAALYKQFHLDEPWDSEHNRTLIDKMPAVYNSPLAKVPHGQTVYLAPVGAGLAFDGKAGTQISQITDGTSNTILIVEATAAKAVPWTRPEDLPIDPQKPLEGLEEGREVIPMLLGDGSVHRESTQGDPQTYYEMMTRAGGEVIDQDKLTPQ